MFRVYNLFIYLLNTITRSLLAQSSERLSICLCTQTMTNSTVWKNMTKTWVHEVIHYSMITGEYWLAITDWWIYLPKKSLYPVFFGVISVPHNRFYVTLNCRILWYISLKNFLSAHFTHPPTAGLRSALYPLNYRVRKFYPEILISLHSLKEEPV